MTISDNRQPSDPVRWLFEDRRTGRIVIAQAPNLALWIVLGAFAAETVLKPVGPLGAAVRLVGAGALGIWALDEIVRGVNPWRRILGTAALVGGPLSILRS